MSNNNGVKLYAKELEKGFKACPKDDQSKLFKVNMQSATVNFVILGKLYNLSMMNKDEKQLALFYMNWLAREKVDALIDGEYVVSCPKNNVVTVTCHATRLIILSRLNIFDAIMFRVCLTLKNKGWLPQTEQLSACE